MYKEIKKKKKKKIGEKFTQVNIVHKPNFMNEFSKPLVKIRSEE